MKLLFSIFAQFLEPVTSQFPPGRSGGMGGLPMGAGLGINDAQLEKEWAQRNELFEIGRKYIFEPEFNDEGMIMPPANLMRLVFKLMLWSQPPIGWFWKSADFIGSQCYLASIDQKTHLSIEDLQKLGSGKIEFDKENMFHVEAGFHKIYFTKKREFLWIRIFIKTVKRYFWVQMTIRWKKMTK